MLPPFSRLCFVTMLMAPTSEEVPYTRAAGPSSISIWSISLVLTGKSTALWPVWGSQMLIPLRSTAICSQVPPLTLMSDCMPITPLWRTSTPTEYLRRSFTLWAGRDARVRLSRTVTILALAPSCMGVRLPVTDTASML